MSESENKQNMTEKIIDNAVWIGGANVRGRNTENTWQFEIAEVTSQARVYKQSLHNFFRQHMPLHPKWGEFEVDIKIFLNPNFPQIDVDNVAKAVLDGIKKHVFVDDSQIMRLLVEKIPAEGERIFIEARKRN